MQENCQWQWQAFVETGDIHYYLQYKQSQLVAEKPPQKELADGCICDLSTGVTRGEV